MQDTKVIEVHEKKLKSLKMDVVSESSHGVLAATSANLAPANYALTAAKAKLAAARNFRIKGKVEQPQPTCCSENPFSL